MEVRTEHHLAMFFLDLYGFKCRIYNNLQTFNISACSRWSLIFSSNGDMSISVSGQSSIALNVNSVKLIEISGIDPGTEFFVSIVKIGTFYEMSIFDSNYILISSEQKSMLLTNLGKQPGLLV